MSKSHYLRLVTDASEPTIHHIMAYRLDGPDQFNCSAIVGQIMEVKPLHFLKGANTNYVLSMSSRVVEYPATPFASMAECLKALKSHRAAIDWFLTDFGVEMPMDVEYDD